MFRIPYTEIVFYLGRTSRLTDRHAKIFGSQESSETRFAARRVGIKRPCLP